MVDHDFKFQSSFAGDKRGLGHGIFTASYTTGSAHRKLCVQKVRELSVEVMFSHCHQLAMQGVWTKWWRKVKSFDYSWNNVLFGPGPRIVSFVLNATINSLPTPDMLKLMNISHDATCKICGAPRCTLHHILVGCSRALQDKRYTWRHDSVLNSLSQAIKERIDLHNQSPVRPPKIPSIRQCFVRAGSSASVPKISVSSVGCLLSPVNDWEILVDFDHKKALFPVHITSTNQRPDIVIWSNSAKLVLLVELTYPAEEGIVEASFRKQARYLPLKKQIEEEKRPYPWKAKIFTIEVGARGFVANSVFSFLRKIGFSSSQARLACKDVSVISARCSYGIWLMRHSKCWNSSRELVSFREPAV